MLYTAKTVKGYKLDALDGEIGKVKEFYFDDRHWTIRYLVADTGGWLPGRQVLIAPYALIAINPDTYMQQIEIDLTRAQIKDSPSLDCDKPVSRQFEENYYGYYGWPRYWTGSHAWGIYPRIERDRDKWGELNGDARTWDHNLRSTHEVIGYHLQATDGEIGHVEDFIFDDETWTIRYLLVNTLNWWPGKKVLVSPKWIERVSWGQTRVFVDISREAIKRSPEYMEEFLLTRDYEEALHQHYSRRGYWVNELAAK